MADAEIIKIDIEKYAEALNNLIGVDSAYFKGDKDVDAIVEVITLAKKYENIINRQKTEIEDLFYKLSGVMHYVDKWLDGDELKQDEVNRAMLMREKTLQMVENLEKENKEIWEERCRIYESLQEAKAENEKEFDRLKEIEWMYNDLNK